MRFLMPPKANRRSLRSAGHFWSMLTSSALVAYRRFDRRVDADKITSGLMGDLAGIPPHLPIPLQFTRTPGRGGTRLGPRFEVGPQWPICGGRPGIGLGPLVEAAPPGLPPGLGAILDIDRRVAIEDVRDPIAQGV